MLQASSAAVSHVLGQTNAAAIGIMSQIHECSTVLACRGFQTSLFHIHLQPARGCALQIATKNLLEKGRKDFSVHTLNNLGDSVTCLLQDCLNIPRLPEYSSLMVSTVNGKVTGNVTSIFCHSITCLGTDQCCWVRNDTSVLHECSPVRVCKGAAYDPVSNKNFLYTLVICTWLCHVACIHKTLGQERERTSHFTLKQLGNSLICVLQDCLGFVSLISSQECLIQAAVNVSC